MKIGAEKYFQHQTDILHSKFEKSLNNKHLFTFKTNILNITHTRDHTHGVAECVCHYRPLGS